ncbi:MAG: universal stress protein [Candidatus Scalindua rubra]|uniref:Universal stress protein n=1 Tax=Candidatus Scalindua brodae TaxID=237368 RepID=A0A0B0EHR4_9BACT|nr:MAG: universal stress protein [Candidatus Scalindua brodae]MBZ0107361.1 universal stress protein [Candidatus Scalindua rubra]TWU31442.1 Universal stress protein [Candidatus Brocadiaceae bacterium S225]
MSQFPNKSILTATDFSEYSKITLDMCLGAYRCMKTKLYVLHTIEKFPHDSRHLSSGTNPEGIKQKLEEDAIDKIKALIPEDVMDKGDIIPMVRFGKPFLETIQVAKENSVDLLVIGTHGRAGVDRVMLGSVAEKIVRKADCPVMVIKSIKYTGFKRIIVPIDFSDCSRKALEYAVSIARSHNNRLTILHVYEKSFVEPYVNAANSEEKADEIMKEIERVNESKYDEFLKTVDLNGVEYEKLLKKGIAETDIVEIAMEQQANLIVMGTHGRSGIKHMLIGSTAEQVVRTVHCDIIIVKPEKFSLSMP